MDQPNADAFLQKVDNNGGSFNFLREGTVMNTRHALVELTKMTLPCYIGIKNPSTFDGVNVNIEVVALVQE
jgi:hypothetical protein